MWLTARGTMSNSLMWSLNGINLSALRNSIKAFQLIELENKQISRHQFSPESENKEKVKTREEKKMVTLRSVKVGRGRMRCFGH